MKKVLVLGGGFAGVGAILEIAQKTKNAELTLVDKRKFHLFTPSLYEVATSEEPQQNIAIPFKELLPKKVKFVQGSVEKIDTNGAVLLEDGSRLEFDFLVIALGSESNYFGIDGLYENSLDLKTLLEAIRIKNTVKEVFEKNSTENKKIKIVIGGGGFSGAELTAEMIAYRDRLAKEYHKSPTIVELAVVEGTDRLLNGLDNHVSEIAKKRLEKAGVKLYLKTFIQEVFPHKFKTKDGQEIDFDILIWTGGVAANHVLKNSGLPINKKGQVEVDEFLRMKGKENIFVLGDVAAYLDPKTGKPAPGVAQVAEEEGRTTGKNIARLLEGKSLQPYNLRHFGYIVPLNRKFVMAEMGPIHLEGILAWFLQQLVFLNYLLGILPFMKALTHWNHFELELDQE